MDSAPQHCQQIMSRAVVDKGIFQSNEPRLEMLWKSTEPNDSLEWGWVFTVFLYLLYIFCFMDNLQLLHSEFLYGSLVFSNESPSRRFRNWLFYQGNINFWGTQWKGWHKLETSPSLRKSWVSFNKESFLSKPPCLGQLTRIQTTGLGDYVGKDTINQGKTSGFGWQRIWVGSSIGLYVKRFQELKTLLETKLRFRGNGWSHLSTFRACWEWRADKLVLELWKGWVSRSSGRAGLARRVRWPGEARILDVRGNQGSSFLFQPLQASASDVDYLVCVSFSWAKKHWSQQKKKKRKCYKRSYS